MATYYLIGFFVQPLESTAYTVHINLRQEGQEIPNFKAFERLEQFTNDFVSISDRPVLLFNFTD